MDDGTRSSQAKHIPSVTHLAEFVTLRSARQPACVRKHHRQHEAPSDARQFAYFYARLFGAIRKHVRSGYASDDIRRVISEATPQQRPSFEEVAEGLVPALQRIGAVDGRPARRRAYYDDENGEHLVSVYSQFVLTLADGADMYVHVHTAREPLSPAATTLVVELLAGAYPGEKVAVIDARRGTVVIPDARPGRVAVASHLEAYLQLWATAA